MDKELQLKEVQNEPDLGLDVVCLLMNKSEFEKISYSDRLFYNF